MKKGIVILLSLIILSGTCKELTTCAKFHFNKDFIVNNFCVNLYKPQTKCGGKCYLKKSLIENEAEQQGIPNQTKEKESTIDLIPTYIKGLNVARYNSLHQKQNPFFNKTYSYTYLKEIFQPPQLST